MHQLRRLEIAFYGDMLEVIILKLKENDEAVLASIKKLIAAI